MDSGYRRRLIFWGTATLLIMGAIFFFSSQPADDSSELSGFLLNTRLGQLLMRLLPALSDEGASHDIRKYAHMTEYFCLGASASMFFRELARGRGRRDISCLRFSLPFCLLYACSDELHQLFVEGRSCQLSDVGIDGIGIAAGTLIALIAAGLAGTIKKRKKRGELSEGGTV